MKKTKRSLITSLVTLLLCSAMFVGSTFAWFTDSVSNTGNKIQAGTLKIDLLQDKEEVHTAEGYVSIKDNTAPVFDSGESTGLLWEPGQTQVAYLAVKNNGNLALKYNIILDVVDRETNEDLTQAMAGAFNFAIIDSGSEISTKISSWSEVSANSVKLLDAIHAAAQSDTAKSARITAAPNGKLLPEQTDYFAIAIHMNEEAGNAYQNGLIEFDVNVVATQLNSELDGFDSPDYDKDATYPGLAPMINTSKTKKVEEEGQKLTIEDEYAKSEIPAAIEDVQIISTNDEEKYNFAMETNSDLTRNIKTKNATEDSVVVDIGYVYTETTGDVTKSYDVTKFNGVVKNTIKLSAGLKNVEVTHSHGGISTPMVEAESETSGIDGEFFYNDSTGNLTIWSSEYSDFIVKYDYDFVAAIGSTGYFSLDEAAKGAKANETIKVLKDTDVPADVAKDVTLEVNGKQVSKVSVNDATLTVKGGGTFHANTNDSGIINIDEGTYQNVTFGGSGTVNITGGNYAELGKLSESTVDVKVSGGTFSSDPSIYVIEGKKASFNEVTNLWEIKDDPITLVYQDSDLTTAGGNFKLMNDVTISTQKSFKNVSNINLNGYTLTLTKGFRNSGDAEVNIKGNGGKVVDSASDGWFWYQTSGVCKVTFDNAPLEINNTSNQFAFYVGSPYGSTAIPELTIEGVHMEGIGYLLRGAVDYGQKAKVTCNNCYCKTTIKGQYNNSYGPVMFSGNSNQDSEGTFNNCTLINEIGGYAVSTGKSTGNGYIFNNCHLESKDYYALYNTGNAPAVFNGGEIIGAASVTIGAGAKYGACKVTNKVTYNGTTINYNGTQTQRIYPIGYWDNPTDKFVINVGTKLNGTDVNYYTLAEGLKWSEKDTNGFYTVIEE